MYIFGLVSILGVIFNWAIATFLFTKGKKMPERLFGFVTFALGVWCFSCSALSFLPKESYTFAITWYQIGYTAVILLPVLYLHFVIRYLNLTRKPLIMIAYFVSFFFLFLNWFNKSRFFWGDLRFVFNRFYWMDWFAVKSPFFLTFYFLFYWVLLGYSFFLLVNRYIYTTGQERNKFKYLIIGSGLGWIGGELNYLPAFQLDLLHTQFIYTLLIFGVLLTAVYTFIIFYAIVRHQLMDIEVIIKKTIVFAGLLTSIFASLILPTLILQEYIFRAGGFGGRLLGLTLSGVIIIFSMRRIENFLINVTDKFLFQKKYNYKELLKTFTSEVLTVLDLKKLVRLTVDKLSNIIKLQSCGILLLDEEANAYKLVASLGIKEKSMIVKADNTLISFLSRTKTYLSVNSHEKEYRPPAKIITGMNKLQLELAIPLIKPQGEMIGIITLGKKKSDEDYTQDDMDILLPLARTLAIAISNAEMFEELGKTQAEAAQKEKMAVIGTLSAGINHEICNPLGIARGHCEAFLLNIKDGLYKGKSTEELLEKAKVIMDKVIHETDRATVITKRLSSFAKPSKGLVSDDISIKNEIDEVLALVGYELKLDKIDIEKDIDENVSFISGNKKQLQEVFFNLIRNAAQAMKERGKITIKAGEKDNKVVVNIEDTGQGIPENKLEQIFNPFYTTKEPGKGTGLGLFIVRQIVEKNKGRISVKSKVNEGTVFTLEFPNAAKERVN